MTGQETRRAIAEARRAVGASSGPVTHLENALQKYLSATTHLSHPTEPATVPPATAVRTNDQVPKAAAPTTLVGATTVDSPFIVVAGVDASSCSRRAARWAAAEALRRNGSLLLIHAYSLPPAGYSGYNPYPASLLPQLREEGEAMLSDIAAALGRDYPALNIETRMTYGDPATVLRHAS
ncbi:MAG: universal stress protein, partial [Nakamurella sp.]